MTNDDLREAVERSLDGLAKALPAEPKQQPTRELSSYIPARVGKLVPAKEPETLQPAHKALIGKWATVDLPDGEGEARLRIYTVTLRRDGRVRAEMRHGGTTIYRTPEELRNVGEK